MNKLSETEIKRYNRHILLDEIGESGQLKLKNASVLVVGVGGLGAPVSLYLASSGIGNIGIIDADTVDISNLPRQVLYSENEQGQSKVLLAKEKLRQQNPNIIITAYNYFLTNENAHDLIQQYDVIVIATDNSKTRYLIDAECKKQSKPMVHGSVSSYEGQVGIFNCPTPAYSDIFPKPPREDFENEKSKALISPLPGIIGCIQANEVIKFIVGFEEILKGKLLIFNAIDYSVAVVEL